MDKAERDEVRREFRRVVNMPPRALERWLTTAESNAVGQKGEDGEAVGHKMGHRILEIRAKKLADLSEDDYEAMRKVVGYVHRHMAQGGPAEDVEQSRWRFSLMNWGHDPLKG